jgi:membrane-associated phospholipid phosphatase
MRKVALLLLLIPNLLSAQQDSAQHRADVLRIADGILHTYTAPTRWKSNDLVELAIVLGSTATLTAADQPIRDFWSEKQGRVLDCVNEVGYHFGKPYSGFFLGGGMYAAGLIVKNEWVRETGMALTTSLVTAGILEMTLKSVVGRARPQRELGNYNLTLMNDDAGFHSFPSGHASMAFTIAFVMAKRSTSVPVKTLFYSLAASTAVCRLYSDAHWISDIAFGGILAWYCSEAAVSRLEANRLRNPHRNTKWKVSPYPGGLTLRGTFM